MEEAIQRGLQQLGLSRAQVIVKILDEGEHGLFGQAGARPARVRLLTRRAKKRIE